MKNGYFKDSQDRVIGYWELPEKPVDTDSYKWIESTDRPPIWLPPEKVKANRIFEIDRQLLEIDQKSIRALRAGETARVQELEGQASALRVERAGL